MEGYEDLRAVAHLMGAHVSWPDNPRDAPVRIIIGNSVSEILEEGYLTAQVKSQEIKRLGIMLDANDCGAQARYREIRERCKRSFPTLDTVLPKGGVVCNNTEGKRIGAWIMPDNESAGYLETFLKVLVPDQARPVWNHAVDAVQAAIDLGAECREPHLDKARLYSWLAWQRSPGQSPGIAVSQKVLDPNSPLAEPFVRWFRKLFEL